MAKMVRIAGASGDIAVMGRNATAFFPRDKLADLIHQLCALPQSPELEGCYPIVLWLKEDERDTVMQAFKEVYPNAKAKKL